MIRTGLPPVSWRKLHQNEWVPPEHITATEIELRHDVMLGHVRLDRIVNPPLVLKDGQIEQLAEELSKTNPILADIDWRVK